MNALLSLLLVAAPASPSIRPEAVRAHMEFLASDLLEGRRTGTRGYDVAAAYVAAQFESAGLAPGAGGSYFQQVPFREGIVEAAELVFSKDADERRPVFRQDFLATAGLSLAKGEVRASIVYVGFGVTAPERGYDDYAGLDVRGKIVLMAGGGPASFPSDERAHHSSRRTKRENAIAHGAAAVLGFSLPEDEKRFPWARALQSYGKGAHGWRHPDGRVEGGGPELQAAGALNASEAERLLGGPEAFAAAVREAEAGKPRSRELGWRGRLSVATRHRDFASPNVVAVLEGADPALRGEAVVFSAHLDHEGVGEAVEGDAIWNGAFDNASGVAALLEIARSLAAGPRPKRSVVFVATVAEEEGLLGADYFAHHPTLTPVANLNTDMFLALFPVSDVVALGAEHSSLGATVAKAASEVGFAVAPDPFPRETLFVRSDQYPFVRRGVPAVAISAGFSSSAAGAKDRDAILEWVRTRYHTPKDDLSVAVDWDSLVRFAELNRRIGLRLASHAERPSWNAGDFFGRLFGPRS